MTETAAKRSKAGSTIVALGDVVDIINRYWDRDTAVPERLVAGEHIDEGELRVRRWAMTDDDLIPPTFNRWFQSGDVLLHSRNIKKVAQPDFGGITGEKLFILRTKDDSVLVQSLVPYLVQSEVFRYYAESRWAGSTNKFLNKTPLQEFEFALPPIEEQRRLAAALRATEAASESQRVLAERSVLASHALLDFHLELRVASAQRVLVGDLLVDGPTNGLSPKASTGDLGLHTVSIGAVSHGVFDPTNHRKFIDLTPEQASPYLVRKNDIFAVRGNGNRQLVARVGQASESYDDLIYPDLLIRMRFDPSRVVGDYLIAQWNHPSVHARLLSRAKSSNGIWKVNGQDIRSHELMIPPLQVQEDVGKSLRLCTAAAKAGNLRKATLARVIVSIMKRTVGARDE
ncbi:MAG: hypothetical protein Q8T13_21450 [Acidobacteriota bacterium]|nr:hypothetical protein [Acidobacteriota bacterium]